MMAGSSVEEGATGGSVEGEVFDAAHSNSFFVLLSIALVETK